MRKACGGVNRGSGEVLQRPGEVNRGCVWVICGSGGVSSRSGEVIFRSGKVNWGCAPPARGDSGA